MLGQPKNAYKNTHRKRPLKRHFVGKTSSGIDVARGGQKDEKSHSPNGIRVFVFLKPEAPLAISAPGKKLSGKTPEKFFRGLVGGLRTETKAISEGKTEEKKQFPTWSSKSRGKRPYSVERADALSTENIISDAFSARKVERRRKTKQNLKCQKSLKYWKT